MECPSAWLLKPTACEHTYPLDLIVKIAGFHLRDRWAGWTRQPFNSGRASQVAEDEKVQKTEHAVNSSAPALL